MLTVHNIIKKFGDTTAVGGVSFTIKPGEIFSLIGPNSSGKTTIVKSIVGLLHIDEGEITVGGVDVAKNPKDTKALIGYIPDEPSVWGNMTGLEFLHFVGVLYGMSPDVRATKVAELLPIFSLEESAGGEFQNYSRGTKQKFSILAALMHEPKLLLVDEPIVGLDPDSAMIAKKLFSDFAKNGGAVLLVTHTLPVAEEIATRIGVLTSGVLHTEGTISELRSRAGGTSVATLEEIFPRLTQHS